jgi:hypothetical protein
MLKCDPTQPVPKNRRVYECPNLFTVRLALPLVSMLFSVVGGNALAATFTVAPDGSGDYSTIQEAIEASSSGDTVELLPGVFTGPGNRDLNFLGKSITLQSQNDDPSGCVIDCQDTSLGISFRNGETRDAVLRGVTIRRGRWLIVGGLLLSFASPTIENCRLVENTCTNGMGGGGLFAEYSNAYVTDCVFDGNFTALGGAGLYCSNYPAPEIRRCTFRDNLAVSAPFGSAGAIYCDGASPIIEGCTMYRNEVDAGASAVYWIHSGVEVLNCTVVENRGGVGSFRSSFGSNPIVENCLVAFNDTRAVHCEPGLVLRCCDLYGNTGGDWVSCIAGQEGGNGNLQVDPLFCYDDEDDWSLHGDSLCAEENNPECGQIGAWGVGCAPVPVVEVSWGQLKARYIR